MRDNNKQHAFIGSQSQSFVQKSNTPNKILYYEISLEVEDIEIAKLKKLVAEAKILEKKKHLEKELKSFNNKS